MTRPMSVVGRVLCCGAMAILADAQAVAQQITFRITEDDRVVPCRIHLNDSAGKPVRPEGLPFWRDHFVCDGSVRIPVSEGVFQWEVERGPEYRRQSGKVTVETGETETIAIELGRVANLREDGWYSGDLHVHRPAEDVPLLMAAEDLDFAPVIEWWNGRGDELDAVEKRDVRFDGHRIRQLRAGEDEREGGALLYFGLDRPLELAGSRREVPSPMKFVAAARQRNPNVWIDIEKPFWWDVPTWLASGKMNSIGLANNHMCRSQMLESEAWGKPRDVARLPNPTGNGYWTQELYYHLLNAGLRLPPSAGSASGVLPNPVGYNRVYVQLGDESFTIENWFEGLAGGRCFVTNGPLLRVRTANQMPGSTLALSGNQTREVPLEIELTTQDTIDQLEVIVNGEVVKRISCSAETHQILSTTLSLSEPGWLLVRAIADVDSTFRFASTGPWYVESDSVTHRVSARSARFFLDWTQERIARIKTNVGDERQRQVVLEPHAQAIVFWQQRLRDANAD